MKKATLTLILNSDRAMDNAAEALAKAARAIRGDYKRSQHDLFKSQAFEALMTSYGAATELTEDEKKDKELKESWRGLQSRALMRIHRWWSAAYPSVESTPAKAVRLPAGGGDVLVEVQAWLGGLEGKAKAQAKKALIAKIKSL
jgi:hypothetical protein